MASSVVVGTGHSGAASARVIERLALRVGSILIEWGTRSAQWHQVDRDAHGRTVANSWALAERERRHLQRWYLHS